LIRLPLLVLLLSLLAAAVAVAAPTKRYDLLYTWETSVERVLSYQGKLGRVSGLPNNSQLQVVGMGRGYGLVHPARTSLAQAKAMAAGQKAGLRRAGLKDAQTVAANGYQRLYHVRYAQGANLQQLSRDRGRIGAALGTQVADRLVIEKLDARTHAIVYRCWANKNEAQQLAGKHRTLLRAHKLTPAVVAAAVRPAVSDASGLATVAKPAKGQDKGQARAAVAVPPSTAARAGDSVKARAPVATQVRVAEVRTGQGKKAAPAVREVAAVPAATAGLNGDLQSFLRKQQARGRLGKNDSTALVAYDLTSNTYLASHNAQRSFQAASMIKPFVALAFFHQVDKGQLKYTAKHRQMMERMIQHSDNEATNWFMRQVGGPARCQALLKKEYGPLVRRVNICEYIPPGGKTYRNSAQPTDYIAYLKALWQHRLPHSREMLRVMALPGRDRIYWGTQLPKGTQVYNKTGTTAHLCGDMGIIVPPGKRQAPYIIVGIVQRPSKPKDFKHWMVSGGNVIRDFSTLVYREMQDRYTFL
jgi:beta-lactamase class A